MDWRNFTPIGIFESVFEAYSKRWHAKRRRLAAQNPEWAEIEARRLDPNSPNTRLFLSNEAGLGLEEFYTQQKIEDELCPHTWMHRLKWWLDRHPGVSAPIHTLRTYHHRARHGWAPADVWNLDSHLAEVIAGSVAWLRDHGHTYTGASPEEWQQTLTEIEEGFRAYLEDATNEDETNTEEARARLVRSFQLLSDHYPHLWD